METIVAGEHKEPLLDKTEQWEYQLLAVICWQSRVAPDNLIFIVIPCDFIQKQTISDWL